MFWGRYSPEIDTSFEVWKNRQIEITELGKLTLLSHSRLDNQVILYTYQPIAGNIPSNVEVINASEIFNDTAAYDALSRGHRVCHVSDVIRLVHAGQNTGVVIDMDTVVLRKFPETGFIGSMPAKLTGGFAPKWGKAHPPLKIIDNGWDGKALIDFPVSVDEDMKQAILEIGIVIAKRLGGEPIKGFDGWNAICRQLENIPVKILPPFYTCPVPPWKNKGCYSLESPTRLDGETTLYGQVMPSVERILNESLAVQHFFESSFRGEYRSEKGFWEEVKEGSFLASEAEYVLGKDWRRILNESDNVLE